MDRDLILEEMESQVRQKHTRSTVMLLLGRPRTGAGGRVSAASRPFLRSFLSKESKQSPSLTVHFKTQDTICTTAPRPKNGFL